MSTKPTNTYRCRTCGHETRSYVPMQRHVDETHGGGRIEIVIPKGENRGSADPVA